MTATGGGPPYVWTDTDTNGNHTLPPGLTIDPDSGTISGMPTTAGNYSRRHHGHRLVRPARQEDVRRQHRGHAGDHNEHDSGLDRHVHVHRVPDAGDRRNDAVHVGRRRPPAGSAHQHGERPDHRAARLPSARTRRRSRCRTSTGAVAPPRTYTIKINRLPTHHRAGHTADAVDGGQPVHRRRPSPRRAARPALQVDRERTPDRPRRSDLNTGTISGTPTVAGTFSATDHPDRRRPARRRRRRTRSSINPALVGTDVTSDRRAERRRTTTRCPRPVEHRRTCGPRPAPTSRPGSHLDRPA